ncbi:MAG: M23 family metallopeptidase, partial [Actinobacteria bacterium]
MEPVPRLALLVALLAALAGSAAPVQAQTAEASAPPVSRIRVVRALTFPVVGPARYEDAFGDCRDDCNRAHHGIDIFSNGWKGVPVVAAHSGIVERAEVYGKRSTCAIHIRAADGWETRYLHLNTDTPGTDDGAYREGCAAPGVTVGSYVAAGQIIGWLGDSGNAEYNSV